jgi:hypothetical protein
MLTLNSLRSHPNVWWTTSLCTLLLIGCLEAFFGILTYACDTFAVRQANATSSGECIEFWINRYQTIIAVAGAFAGAWSTIRAVREQIAHSDKQEKQRRDYEEYAARSIMPLALSHITDYAGKCIVALVGVLQSRKGITSRVGSSSLSFTIPDFPKTVIEPLQNLVKYSEKEYADQISYLLAFLQIQHGRLSQLQANLKGPAGSSTTIIVTDFSIQSAIFDAAELYSKAEMLFEYARRVKTGETTSHVGYDQLFNALYINGIREEDHQELFQVIRLKKGVAET